MIEEPDPDEFAATLVRLANQVMENARQAAEAVLRDALEEFPALRLYGYDVEVTAVKRKHKSD